MSENTKRWLISSGVTFLAGFALVLVAELDNLTLSSLGNGAAVGVVFTGVRAGFKAVLESFLVWYSNR